LKNLKFNVAAAFSVDRVGRRLIFIDSWLGMLVSIALVSALFSAFATTGMKTATAVVPIIFLSSGLFHIVFTTFLYAYVYVI
jgi:hypothetical protein